MADAVQLKKYSNRRLYDAEQKAFVTLSQVAEMIRQGRQVEVLEVDTREDVTAYILTLIILEETKKKATPLPPTLLNMIIRYGDTAQEFFEKHLELAFKNYLAYKASVDEQFQRWLASGMDFPATAPESKQNPPRSKGLGDPQEP